MHKNSTKDFSLWEVNENDAKSIFHWSQMANCLDLPEIPSLVCVSERTVWQYIALFQQTGDVEVQHREYGPKGMLGDLEQLTLLHLENHGI